MMDSVNSGMFIHFPTGCRRGNDQPRVSLLINTSAVTLLTILHQVLLPQENEA